MTKNERTYSREIADAVSTFLHNDDWHFSFDEEDGVFTFGLGVKGRLKKIRYLIAVRQAHYIVYATVPIGVDEDDRTTMREMADFICRANYGLKCGNFELDMDDGQIRYKVYVDCRADIPAESVIKNSVYCPAAMFERYGDGILDVIFQGVSGKDAVSKCEDNSAQSILRSVLGDAAQQSREESEDSSEESSGESTGDSRLDELLSQLLSHLGSEGEGSDS